MAKFISQSLILPKAYLESNESVIQFSQPLDELAGFNQLSLTRSMNRNAMALAACARKLQNEILQKIKDAPDRVGIYCAVDQTSTQHPEIAKFMNSSGDLFASYSKTVPPRLAFQTSIGLVGSSLAILLGARGGVYTFHHPQFGCLHALEQAQLDLNSQQIEYALLCSVASAEDPICLEKYRRMSSTSQQFCEAAAIIVLSNNDQTNEMLTSNDLKKPSDYRYGISTPLVNFFKDKIHEI